MDLDSLKSTKFSKINGKVKLLKVSLGIIANFEVQFVAELVCARCLNNFSKEFNTSLILEYVEGKDPYRTTEKVELRPEDIDKVFFCGSEIDLSTGLREAIILSLPTVPLCKEDCLGLCPVCGKNLNEGKCQCKAKNGSFSYPPITHR